VDALKSVRLLSHPHVHHVPAAGTMPLDTERHWHIPGKAAVVLAPKPKRDPAGQEP
jgi:hypothetical protein